MNGKRILLTVGTACGVVLVALAAFFAGRSSGMKAAEERAAAGRKVPSRVTATVRTQKLREGQVRATGEAYGAVVPSPDGQAAVAVSYPCRVVRVLARDGQYVRRGEAVLEVEASPDTKLVLARARHSVEASEQALKSVRAKYALKLADRAQLAQAQMDYKDAKAQLDSLLKRKAGGVLSIRAQASGTVYQVRAKKGDLVQSGQPLLTLVDNGRLEVRLGVRPSEAHALKRGDSVDLHAAGTEDGRSGVKGRVRAVGAAVNSASRMVDVYVSLPADAHFPLGSFVRGGFVVGSGHGLVAPYASVLPEKGRNVLFTVEGGKAVRHDVSVGIDNGREVLVSGKGLAAGDPVVVLGNYELEDGMAVKAEPAP